MSINILDQHVEGRTDTMGKVEPRRNAANQPH